jgi:hypothetical protein
MYNSYLFNNKPLLDQIQNQAVGLVGNMVVFPLIENGQLKRHASLTRLVAERFVSLPTRGVFAETLLSRCNATEQRDVTRVIDAESGCRLSAPDITGITPGSRRSAPDLQPTPFPSSMISIQNAPFAPEPTALRSALEVLRTPEIFRNMSLGAETVATVQALARQALQESGESQRQALELASRLLAAYFGIPLPPTGSTRSAGNSAGGSALSTPAARSAGSAGGLVGGSSAAGSLDRLINTVAGEGVRVSSPARVYDQLQNISSALKQGAITDDDARTAAMNLLGAPSGTAALRQPLQENCGFFGPDAVVTVTAVQQLPPATAAAKPTDPARSMCCTDLELDGATGAFTTGGTLVIGVASSYPITAKKR